MTAVMTNVEASVVERAEVLAKEEAHDVVEDPAEDGAFKGDAAEALVDERVKVLAEEETPVEEMVEAVTEAWVHLIGQEDPAMKILVRK